MLRSRPASPPADSPRAPERARGRQARPLALPLPPREAGADLRPLGIPVEETDRAADPLNLNNSGKIQESCAADPPLLRNHARREKTDCAANRSTRNRIGKIKKHAGCSKMLGLLPWERCGSLPRGGTRRSSHSLPRVTCVATTLPRASCASRCLLAWAHACVASACLPCFVACALILVSRWHSESQIKCLTLGLAGTRNL